MSADLLEWLILAQADGAAPAEGAAQAAGDGNQPPFWTFIVPYLPIILLFYFLLILPQRREQKKRDKMLSEMKKNDRVVTSSGIIGSIANISADGKEITLKVDDNTRIRFLRSSITHVLGEESSTDAAAKSA
jgi:preprotein translocase subunit YajC